jgi:hypothetical protein
MYKFKGDSVIWCEMIYKYNRDFAMMRTILDYLILIIHYLRYIFGMIKEKRLISRNNYRSLLN